MASNKKGAKDYIEMAKIAIELIEKSDNLFQTINNEFTITDKHNALPLFIESLNQSIVDLNSALKLEPKIAEKVLITVRLINELKELAPNILVTSNTPALKHSALKLLRNILDQLSSMENLYN